ncbi:MAG: DUF1643 domain-containing protein [Mycobacterium sp.]|nr:DUF1643 domain-containing protein [Mycobacterium sp.]
MAPGRYIEAWADISSDGLYRWRLFRRWGAGPTLMMIGLNPSTADGQVDDATIVRECNFAKRFQYSALMKLNLYAGRATDPRALWAMPDPIGAENDAHLDREGARHDQIVLAWGSAADPVRARAVAQRVWRIGRSTGANLAILGWTSTNQPRHPLYLRSDTPLQRPPAGTGVNIPGPASGWRSLLGDPGGGGLS